MRFILVFEIVAGALSFVSLIEKNMLFSPDIFSFLFVKMIELLDDRWFDGSKLCFETREDISKNMFWK